LIKFLPVALTIKSHEKTNSFVKKGWVVKSGGNIDCSIFLQLFRIFPAVEKIKKIVLKKSFKNREM